MNIEAALKRFLSSSEHTISPCPTILNAEDKALWIRLIKEEVEEELLPALESDDMIEIADGIADGVYVLVGTAVAMGIPFNDLFREVHGSNMLKIVDGVQKDAGGKTIKPEGWEPPDIERILREACP